MNQQDKIEQGNHKAEEKTDDLITKPKHTLYIVWGTIAFGVIVATWLIFG